MMDVNQEWIEQVQVASRKAYATLSKRIEEVESSKDYREKPVASDDLRQLITIIRDLLEEGTQAVEFDELRADRFTRDISLVSTVAVAMMDNSDTGAGGGESCTNRCRRERSACITEECGPGSHSWPCGCCVPCNVTWMACLGDCVLSVHAFPSGVLM